MRRHAGGRGKHREEEGLVVVEVRRCRRCVYICGGWGIVSVPGINHARQMIEMNSTGSLGLGICDIGSTLQNFTWSCLTDR